MFEKYYVSILRELRSYSPIQRLSNQPNEFPSGFLYSLYTEPEESTKSELKEKDHTKRLSKSSKKLFSYKKVSGFFQRVFSFHGKKV